MKITNDMGKTIDEKMKEYNEMRQRTQARNRNTRNVSIEIAYLSWPKTLMIAVFVIIIGSIVMYSGIKSVKKTIVNSEDRVYTRGEITNISFAMGNYETKLEIEYFADGKMQESEILTNKDREAFARGEIIGIYYYKDNPYKIYSTSEDVSNVIIPIIGAVFIIVGFMIVFVKIKSGNIKR